MYRSWSIASPLRQWCSTKLSSSCNGGWLIKTSLTCRSLATLCAEEVKALHEKFEFAHEAVANIGPSAVQAQMEHEPSERVPAVEYRVRYARFALEEVERALTAFEEFCQQKNIELFSERDEGNYHGEYPEQEVQKLRRQQAFLHSYRDNLKAELEKANTSSEQDS